MKRRTLWIIGITTALVTSVALRAAVGHRYGDRNHWKEHACWNEKKDATEKSTAPQSDPANAR